MTMTSHAQRILTALIALPLIGAAVYQGGVLLFFVLLVVSSLGLWEFYSLFWEHKEAIVLKGLGILTGGLVLYAGYHERLWMVMVILLAFFWLLNLIFMVQLGSGKNQHQYDRLMVLFSGQIYLPLLLMLALWLSAVEIVFVLVAAFATDTGAFYAGSYLGKHKLWPAISPKKTWIGSIGGCALCILATTAIGLSFGQADWPVWIAAGFLLSIAAQVGDLFESALKRSLRVKDSGHVLPGHGGILDRIDSLLLALPVYLLLRSTLTLF
ncbi:MAG: phosphatidate cytidylyltransferase [Desulfovibrionales bacterium]